MYKIIAVIYSSATLSRGETWHKLLTSLFVLEHFETSKPNAAL